MTDTAVSPSPASTPSLPGTLASRPFLPLLVILFVGSGCAALIYEIIWYQLLSLVIGASAISLGVLLGTFMGGMCLGSLLYPKLVSRSAHPMMVYGLLELAIGVMGVLILVIVPFAASLYTGLAEPGAGAVFLRALVAGMCLLPPTILMGATLPAIARYVEASPNGVSWMGFFYGGNTVGAVFGCLLAGFFLMPNYSMTQATWIAASINATVAFLAIMLSLVSTYKAPRRSEIIAAPPSAPGAWAAYIAIGLSGLTGLGTEVIWTRELSLMLGATTYTFSNILAVFLAGLGIGSTVGAIIARTVSEPRAALAWCQLLLAGAIAWAAYSITHSLPFWPIQPYFTISPWHNFQMNLAQCAWTVLPGAVLWGASFPMALAAIARRGQDPGKLVGGVYAVNTVGAIIGSLVFSMIAIPGLGTQNAQRLVIVICLISGIIAMMPVLLPALRARRDASETQVTSGTVTSLIAALLLAFFAGSWLISSVNPPNWPAVAWGRNAPENMTWVFPPVLTLQEAQVLKDANTRSVRSASLVGGKLQFSDNEALDRAIRDVNADWLERNESTLVSLLRKRLEVAGKASTLAYGDKRAPDRYCVYLGEGMNVSVAVTQDMYGNRFFHGAGKVQASSIPEDMRLQRLLGHVSALTNFAATGKAPKDVLVVACGAGVTAGSYVPYGANITIVDIEKMVPWYVTPQFHLENHDVIPPEISGRKDAYKNTRVIIDDGRHFVRTTREKYDVITSDPIDPWVKGCAALNTIEYYQMCRDRLKPGGTMALWIPLYESSEDTTKSIIATFFKVFPQAIIWSNERQGMGYDCVLFGHVPLDPDDGDKPLKIDIAKVQEFIDAPENRAVKDSLNGVGFGSRGVVGSGEAVEVFATFAGTAPRMTAWIRNTDHLINTDANLRLQYIAGLWINNDEADMILRNILRHYSYPDDIFDGTPAQISALKQIFSMTGRHDSAAAPQE